jgi:type III secretory pathway lipoprotein EscJ
MHHDDASRRRGPRVTPAQVVGIGLVAASLGWAAWLLRDRPISEEVELLSGTVLPSSEMAIVEAAFDRAQLSDHRTEGGRVWVPRQRQSAYMRALVDAEALPREFGSSLRRALENNSPWQSRAVQEEMLRVAIQEELAHVICSMPGIERAAVLYDVDQRPAAGGLSAAAEPTASVNIRTQAGIDLEPARVQAIRVLVAASIAGLPAERVAVTDLRSGRVFAGPLASDPAGDDIARADPALARRIVHERHLATKLRQALAFVEGAIVDVTVTFTSPAPPTLPPPPPAAPAQRVADANAPAAVAAVTDDDEAAVVPLPVEPAPSADETFPATILVSLAVPETFFTTESAAAGQSEPTTDHGMGHRPAEERLREHVLSLLPPTTRADGRRVVLTRFPVTGTAVTRPNSADRVVPSAADRRADLLTDVVSLEAAWQAILEGRPGDVPREIWLGVIAVAAGLLGWLVLRPQAAGRDAHPARRRSARPIDHSAVAPAADGDSSRRQVAA